MWERSGKDVVALSFAGVIALGASACTSSTGGAPDAGQPSTADDEVASTTDAAPTCQHDNYPVDPWAPPIAKVGKPASGDDAGAAGALTFTLVSDDVGDAAASPAQPFTNVFTMKLTDSSGQPVTNATVLLPTKDQALGWTYSADPWMPLHGHGASILPSVTNNMDGTYAVSTYFFMPGFWWVYLVAETDTVTDSALFSFCVP